MMVISAWYDVSNGIMYLMAMSGWQNVSDGDISMLYVFDGDISMV